MTQPAPFRPPEPEENTVPHDNEGESADKEIHGDAP